MLLGSYQSPAMDFEKQSNDLAIEHRRIDNDEIEKHKQSITKDGQDPSRRHLAFSKANFGDSDLEDVYTSRKGIRNNKLIPHESAQVSLVPTPLSNQSNAKLRLKCITDHKTSIIERDKEKLTSRLFTRRKFFAAHSGKITNNPSTIDSEQNSIKELVPNDYNISQVEKNDKDQSQPKTYRSSRFLTHLKEHGIRGAKVSPLKGEELIMELLKVIVHRIQSMQY